MESIQPVYLTIEKTGGSWAPHRCSVCEPLTPSQLTLNRFERRGECDVLVVGVYPRQCAGHSMD